MTKQQVRAYFLEKKTGSDSADNERIAAQLRKVLSDRPIKLLHSFIGSQQKNEVDTKRIRQILQAEFSEIQWAAPRMIPGTKQLKNYFWNDATELAANRWGIEEPKPETTQTIDIQFVDAILVPLLAFDRRGHRVGYGGGYYDRFLPHCRPDALKIGLSPFEPIEEIEDAGDWDVKLDICVTPAQIYRWDR